MGKVKSGRGGEAGKLKRRQAEEQAKVQVRARREERRSLKVRDGYVSGKSQTGQTRDEGVKYGTEVLNLRR